MNLARFQDRAHFSVEHERQTDAFALRLRPGDLFRDDPKLVVAVLADQQRGRVIVVGQRSQPVENLVEEILRIDLHHDLPVDPVPDAQHLLAVDELNRF